MAQKNRIGVLGDLHSNLSALEATLGLFSAEGVEEILCVGDVVGYGPRPNEVCAILRERGIQAVAGNHDWALLGKLGLDYFNPYAREALEWTRGQISVENRDWLESLPLRLDTKGWCLFHGCLPRPEDFDYLQSIPAAEKAFEDFRAPIGFFGHTHLPMTFLRAAEGGALKWHFEPDWTLRPGDRALVNVGSPGQPRDENPLAPGLVYSPDTGRVQLLRTPYPIAREQALIRRAGLPAVLGDRLQHGI